MDADGVTGGFDLQMLDDVRREVRVPLIASGGAGRAEDFAAAADHGADAVLAIMARMRCWRRASFITAR